MGEDLGEIIEERKHDRRSIGGPIAVLLLDGVFVLVAFASGGVVGYLIGVVLLLAGLTVLALDLLRWNDRLTLHDHGVVQVRLGRSHAIRYDQIELLQYEVLSRGGLLSLGLPAPLNLIGLGLGQSFRLRVLSRPDVRQRIVLNAACKRKREEIDKVVRVLSIRTQGRMFYDLRRGDAVVWTPRLLITPDGLVLFRGSLGLWHADKPKRCIPFETIRKAELRHGHLLVRVNGRRRCVINSRLAAACPAGWGVFSTLLRQHQGDRATDDHRARH